MFEFSFLPFSTSNTIYFNGEIYNINFNINNIYKYSTQITKVIELTLNIEQNNLIIL